MDKRLEKENNFIIYFKTLYPFGLNTCLNNVQNNFLDNIYLFLYQANKSKVINRFSRGSHRNSKYINNINPDLWLGVLESDFIKTLDIFSVKHKIFTFKLNVLKKLKRVCSTYVFKNQHFKDIIINLLNFKLRNKLKDVSYEYFTMLFQQKSFDNFNISKHLNKLLPFFPVKNCELLTSFKYNIPFSKYIFNYNSLALFDKETVVDS